MPGFCLAANRGTLPATARPASRAIIRRCRDIGVRKSKAGILFHGCSLIREPDSVRKIASAAFACGEVLVRDFTHPSEFTRIVMVGIVRLVPAMTALNVPTSSERAPKSAPACSRRSRDRRSGSRRPCIAFPPYRSGRGAACRGSPRRGHGRLPSPPAT